MNKISARVYSGNIPLSAISLFNFNQQAAELVKSSGSEAQIKQALQNLI
jgi:hypothetical protein